MSAQSIKLNKLLPLLLGFVVMGFIDIVGVSTGFVQKDFSLPDNLAQLIPMGAFLWFFLLSVPLGIIQNKYGKRNMMNLGMLITGISMGLPFISYSFPMMLTTFLLLGIGNTIVQVAANPLLHDIVPHERFSSFMSLSQFVKAICSMMGPIIASGMALWFGNWKLVFAVYGITSLIAVLWLQLTTIEESAPSGTKSSIGSCLGLLKNRYVALLVLGIFLSVGAEVGLSSNIANFLKNKFSISLEDASYKISIYYTALMIGRLGGSFILNWFNPRKFLLFTASLALVSLVLLISTSSLFVAGISLFFAGFGSANLFPILFALNINKTPERSNELSGLMIMSVVGGAIVPPIMGFTNVAYSIQAGMIIPVLCIAYVTGIAVHVFKTRP
jgi:FHS family L-fucose permease-like MFS transporter